jgi:hypothetical protein
MSQGGNERVGESIHSGVISLPATGLLYTIARDIRLTALSTVVLRSYQVYSLEFRAEQPRPLDFTQLSCAMVVRRVVAVAFWRQPVIVGRPTSILASFCS